jgi:choline kinase
MTYIILAAGEGKGLAPITLNCPKSMYKLHEDITIIKRTVKQIRKHDDDAEIVVVVGFMSESIEHELQMENINFVHNPFYKITKSSASLWFAGDYLHRDTVVVLNSDAVFTDEIFRDFICRESEQSVLLMDNSVCGESNYNVRLENEKVLVISNKATNPDGRYCHVIKLDSISARVLYEELNSLINKGMYEQNFEDILTHMIFANGFELFYQNINNSSWAEIDTVDDLIKARALDCEGLY